MIISYIHSLLVMVFNGNMKTVVMLKETLLVLVAVMLISGCGTLAVTERVFGVPEKVFLNQILRSQKLKNRLQ